MGVAAVVDRDLMSHTAQHCTVMCCNGTPLQPYTTVHTVCKGNEWAYFNALKMNNSPFFALSLI